MRTVIIGGGVVGLCSAWYLRKEGYEVTVIERGNMTNGCSYGNMGYISPSHFVPLASPGIVAQGLKWMLRSSSPFYIKPRLNMDLIRWGMAFWRSANARTVEKNTPHLNNLLQLSRELVSDMKTDLPPAFDLTEKGCFLLYKSEKTGDHEKELAAEAAKLQLKTIVCSREQVQQYEPETEVDVAGGVLYLDDCHLNPRKLMDTLYAYLQQQGVQFLLNTELTGFEQTGERIMAALTANEKIEGDTFILANGSWLPQAAQMAGIRLLLQPGKGYSFVNENLQHNLRYPSILVDDRVATTPINRWLRIGGTMELGPHNDNILLNRVRGIHSAFAKYYPHMNIPFPEKEKIWFGYRPVTPDGLPYIGSTRKKQNLYIAGGHAMLGVSAAVGTGQLLASLIAGKKPAISPEAFFPGRKY